MSVLIVGAGPTGLMMGVQLARRGIACRVIDKNKDRAQESRALVLHARSLEIMQSLGLADQFLAAGLQAVDLTILVEGKTRAQMRIGDIGLLGTPFPFILFLSQAKTEELLARELNRLGVQIERCTELVEFTPSATGVTCSVRGPDGSLESKKYSYLVGCDGAHSAVRHGLDLEFPGGSYDQTFVLADVEISGIEDLTGLKMFLHRRGLLAIFPLGHGIQRIIATCTPALMSSSQLDNITLERVEHLASHLSQRELRLSRPQWLANFHLHHRGVHQFRVGRVFIAGDAAHIHSPAGGQGMNTGLQDATNLAWKLALVLKKQGGEALLESYSAERFPVSQRLLKTTDRIFRAAASGADWAINIRNLLAPALAWVVLKSPWSAFLRRRVFRFVSQLGIRYRQGELVEWANQYYTGGLRPGLRAPDAILGGETEQTLFDLLARFNMYHLLCFNFSGTESLASFELSWGPICRVLKFDQTHQALLRSYRVEDRHVYLIRPDGHIALSVYGWQPELITRYFEKFHSPC